MARVYALINVDGLVLLQGTADYFSEYGYSKQQVYFYANYNGKTPQGHTIVEIDGNGKSKKKKKLRVNNELERINQLAIEHGLSYGQYVAQFEYGAKKNEKVHNPKTSECN